MILTSYLFSYLLTKLRRSYNCVRNYTKRGKQLRCMWCSRIKLVERKTTLKCLECGKCFCRDKNNRLSCWPHHVALGGSKALKIWYKKEEIKWVHSYIMNDGGSVEDSIMCQSCQLFYHCFSDPGKVDITALGGEMQLLCLLPRKEVVSTILHLIFW